MTARNALLAGAFLSLAAGCGSTQTSAPTTANVELSRPGASPEVMRGERLLAEGKIEDAKRVFEQAVVDEPRDARAWLDLGLAREAAGDAAGGEAAYRRATELDPGFAEAFNNLGVILRERGRLGDAIPLLERAVALDPEHPAAPFNLALAYEERGDIEAAEAQYLAAIDRLPRDPIPRINLAMMLIDAGRRGEAAEQLRAARPFVHSDVLLSIAVGEGLRRTGHSDEAVSVLTNALRQSTDPPPTELLAELSLAHYARGNLADAEATMRRAIAQDELDPALQYAYGSILAKRGEIGKARSHLRRTIKLDPGGPYADRARARLEALNR